MLLLEYCADQRWWKMLPISSVAVTAPLIDIAYGDSSLQLVGGYPCGGSRPIGRCACAEGVRLVETAGRAAKRTQGPTRTRRAERVPSFQYQFPMGIEKEYLNLYSPIEFPFSFLTQRHEGWESQFFDRINRIDKIRKWNSVSLSLCDKNPHFTFTFNLHLTLNSGTPRQAWQNLLAERS